MKTAVWHVDGSPTCAGDSACLKGDDWQLALSLPAEMAKSSGWHNTIPASLAIALARRMKIWRMALGTWAEMAESTKQHNTITASLTIAIAE